MLPTNIVNAGVNASDLEKNQAGPVEATISELLLSVGDFLNDLMSKVVGQEITIDKLVFNQVDAVNANLFNKGSASNNTVASSVEGIVNTWYDVFLKISISICLVALIAVGIRVMLLSTAEKSSAAKEVAVKWIIGIVILFFFPFVMKYAFELNDALVNMIAEGLGTRTISGSSVGNKDDYSMIDVEFRSPVYVTRYTGILQFGGKEVNEIYYAKLSQYQERNDVMRIMRAYAGITLRFVYVALWYIMLIQLIVLLIKYYKRYFIIALLITIFPLVIAYYISELVQGKKSSVFSSWSKEFFINVFIQTIHAITYGIIAGVAVEKIANDIANGHSIGNWILMLVAITFLFRGEDIVRKIFGADKAGTISSSLETAATIRKGEKQVQTRADKLGRQFKGGKYVKKD
jgi:hypothetical protein